MSSISERVAAGVEWLDGVLPNWWKTLSIDPSEFSMSDGCHCVIGQLNPDGDYNDAIDYHWLDLDDQTAIARGFHHEGQVLKYEDYDGLFAEYAALTDEWTRVITSRREATPDAG